MVEQDNLFSDNEYRLMSEISQNENITQRELSKKLNLSLGSVNILIKKMIKEGLIKMNHVSKRQVFYMLTPVGMMEKAKKTSKYIKIHYKAINETKEKIKRTLEEINNSNEPIHILIGENETNQVLEAAVDEYIVNHKSNNIEKIDINTNLKIEDNKSNLLIYLSEDEEVVKKYEGKINTINLLEII